MDHRIYRWGEYALFILLVTPVLLLLGILGIPILVMTWGIDQVLLTYHGERLRQENLSRDP